LGTNTTSTGASPPGDGFGRNLISARDFSCTRLYGRDCLSRILQVRRAYRARQQYAVDAVVNRNAMRIRLRQRNGLERLVVDCIAHDHVLRAHAANKPFLVVSREHNVFAYIASGHVDLFHLQRLLPHVDDAQLRFTERRHISLGRIFVVKDMVRDGICRQRHVGDDFAEAFRLRIDVNDSDAFPAVLRRNRALERF
jgi:hypothetical protein